jgi:hypothetical protein
MTVATAIDSDPLVDLRVGLIKNGYRIIPVDGKRPRIKGWSGLNIQAAQVEGYSRKYSDHLNTGILCGDVVAVDIDVLDPETAEKLIARLLDIPGATTAPCRTGRAPKCLYIFNAQEPREKLKTGEYLIGGQKCQIEALGIGQQFVAYGNHVDTGQPYAWSNGDPLSVPLVDLPTINPASLEVFLADAEAILAAMGEPVKRKDETEPRRQISGSGETFWQRVNTAALDAPDRWVPELFSSARREAGTGAWRITSKELGRPMEEDISIHPSGIRDFGREQPETAINLVQEYGGAPSPKDAAFWLCERLRTDPKELGWGMGGQSQTDDQESPSTGDGDEKSKKLPKAANDNQPRWPGIISSGGLIASFTPPDYHIDGIVQAGFLYSLTAPTGTGKTAILLKIAALTALGSPLGAREVRQGRVVYFAGENPSDVTMRWIAEAHHSGFDGSTIDVHFIPGTFDIVGLFKEVSAATTKLGGADLVIVDTSAAYFLGSDENANAEMGKHARALRSLSTLPGSPCVLVACHPTKNAAMDNLLPRGGGAFVAEMDGNLTAHRVADTVVKMHWQGKFRGPDFEPVMFDLATVTAPALRDSKGRDIPTVLANVVSPAEARERKAAARRDEDDVLLHIENDTAVSLTSLAEKLGWFADDGAPNKRRAQSATEKLKKSKLAEFIPRVGWRPTKTGMAASAEVRTQRHREASAAEAMAGFVRKNRARGIDE